MDCIRGVSKGVLGGLGYPPQAQQHSSLVASLRSKLVSTTIVSNHDIWNKKTAKLYKSLASSSIATSLPMCFGVQQ